MSAEHGAGAVATQLRSVGSTAVLTVTGEIDMASAPQLTAAIDDALRSGPALLVVDLSGVRFFGSAGLNVLLTAAEAAPNGGLRVVASLQVRRPIEVTALDKVIDVFDSLAAALAAGEAPSIA